MEDQRTHDRRQVTDRRSGKERRSGEDRRRGPFIKDGEVVVEVENFWGEERRKRDRRSSGSRRDIRPRRWQGERRGTRQQVGETKRMLRAVAVAVTVALMAVTLLAAYAIYRFNIPAA